MAGSLGWMADSTDEPPPLWKATAFWQYVAAVLVATALVLLARSRVWPFGTPAPDLGEQPSIFEVLLNDRVMIGIIRAAIVAVAGYVVLSVPALVVDRRWMKGLGSSGLAADEVRRGDRSIQELQETLADTQRQLDDQVRENDLLAGLLLEYEAEQEDDSASEEGGADGPT